MRSGCSASSCRLKSSPQSRNAASRENNVRALLILISATCLLAVAAQAQAQDAAATFPNKPIKIIVCVPAGGGVDTVTRIVAEGLHQKLGQPVVVENRDRKSTRLNSSHLGI